MHASTIVDYCASAEAPADTPRSWVARQERYRAPELLLNGENKLTVRSIFTDEVVKTIDRPAFRAAVDLSYFVDARFLPSGVLKLWSTDLRGRPVVDLVGVP